MIISTSCGIEPNRIVQYKPNVDEAIRLSGLSDIKNIIFQRDEYTGDLSRGDLVWQVKGFFSHFFLINIRYDGVYKGGKLDLRIFC